jgi:hypothetical protein
MGAACNPSVVMQVSASYSTWHRAGVEIPDRSGMTPRSPEGLIALRAESRAGKHHLGRPPTWKVKCSPSRRAESGS